MLNAKGISYIFIRISSRAVIMEKTPMAHEVVCFWLDFIFSVI